MPLSPDERAAARAFLQRCEVRLSTLHRVATALLSGAGLVVLLLAFVRVFGFPLLALWLLLQELTRFYFHSHHLTGESGALFIPRFTLTGLRIPRDELGVNAQGALEEIRMGREQIDFVVPPNASGQAAVDQRLVGYDLPAGEDRQRAEGLHCLVASVDRDLLTEVAKVEAGMVRHLLRLLVVVLRYVKALGVFVVTVLAVFAGAAVVERSAHVTADGRSAGGGGEPLATTSTDRHMRSGT